MDISIFVFFFFQAEDGIRDVAVTGVQTCALPIFDRLKGFEGTLSRGAAQLLTAFKAQDIAGALMYRVWYFASLQYDQDQRDRSEERRVGKECRSRWWRYR